MLNRTRFSIGYARRCVVALGLVAAAAVSGCKNNKPGPITGLGPFAIRIDEIILSPRSPAPGDTVSCSAVIVATDGDGNPVTNAGDFPTLDWSANGGQFLEANKLTVRWIAPATSSLYQVECAAANAVNSTKRNIDVFVNNPVELIASDAGEIHLAPNGTDFAYIHSADISGAAIDVWQYVGGVASDPVMHTSISPTGFGLTISPDLSHAAYSEVTPPGFQKPSPSVDLWMEDLGAGTATRITTDTAQPGAPRRDAFLFPSFSPDGNLLAYQGLRFGLATGDADTFDVYVYNVASGQTVVATGTHGVLRQRNNFWPSFSSDGSWLVFVSDRASSERWELYGLPVTGDVVTTDSASTTPLTNSGGLIASGTSTAFTPPTIRWNNQATNPVAAVLGSGDGLLRLLATNAGGAVVVPVSGFAATAHPREFFWSPDGTKMAVSTSSEIYLVDLSGQATSVLTAKTGDAMQDISWSPDGNWILYRVLRGPASWFELLDVGAGVLTRPVAVTAVGAAGKAASYSRTMVMAAPINAAKQAFTLQFQAGQDTPRVVRVDLSGIIP